MIEIREIRLEDAEKYLELLNRLDRETIFRLYEPNERNVTKEQQREMLKEIIVNKSSLLLVVEEGEELIGYLMAAGRNIKRIAHVVSISLGILQTHVGKGMGTRLFDELEKWARQNGKHRLELTVMENNTAGLALYKKMGFEVEGIKSRSLYVNGEYIDDIYMSKLI